MVYGLLRALPGAPGFLATVIPEIALREFDTSVGVPGPHGFAVRNKAPSSMALLASTASCPASVTAQRKRRLEPGASTSGTRGSQGNPVLHVHFCTVPPERISGHRVLSSRGGAKHGECIVAGNEYLTRQATTLMRFAQATTDPQVVAGLVEKAVDLKSQVDEAIDRSPRAPDVLREN
jgi:hypothetical protein